jgi:preprotein translocase subunit SecF
MFRFLHRLYRNETRVPFIAKRKWFYAASGVLIVIFALSFAFRGFNEGVEFAGGTQFQIPVSGTSITVDQVNDAFTNAGHAAAEPPQQVGSGGTRQIIVKTESLTSDNGNALKAKVADELGLKPSVVTDTTVSSSWGHDVTVKAIEGLIIFLIAVSIYIAVRYQWRMTVGGVLALLHDLVVTAGVYSLVGLEVTPSTIVGLLTILGFSMYDTVVVYDKVAENAKNILGGTRMTYSEAANLAVNQTLMRSINTSLVALLPVAGLLFVGVGLLGVGTLEDLALVLFVGLASGAYSSLFLATPIVVDLTEREPQYKQLTKRVMAKRASEAKRAVEAELVGAPSGATGSVHAPSRPAGQPAPAPRPGARPQRRRK